MAYDTSGVTLPDLALLCSPVCIPDRAGVRVRVRFRVRVRGKVRVRVRVKVRVRVRVNVWPCCAVLCAALIHCATRSSALCLFPLLWQL